MKNAEPHSPPAITTKKITFGIKRKCIKLWVNTPHLSIEEVCVSEVKKIYPSPIRDLMVKVKLSLYTL